MDATTAEIRYQHWMRVIRDCNSSGLPKRIYCQQNGINEKQFYYYQRRLRAIVAAQAELALPEGSFEASSPSAMQQADQPQIVKLQISDTPETNAPTVRFGVNGMDFSVPEDIPVSFLAKLLEATSHGAR